MSFKQPAEECDDVDCPFHGTLSVRGKTMDGVIVSDKMTKSVVVSIDTPGTSPSTRGTHG